MKKKFKIGDVVMNKVCPVSEGFPVDCLTGAIGEVIGVEDFVEVLATLTENSTSCLWFFREDELIYLDTLETTDVKN